MMTLWFVDFTIMFHRSFEVTSAWKIWSYLCHDQWHWYSSTPLRWLRNKCVAEVLNFNHRWNLLSCCENKRKKFNISIIYNNLYFISALIFWYFFRIGIVDLFDGMHSNFLNQHNLWFLIFFLMKASWNHHFTFNGSSLWLSLFCEFMLHFTSSCALYACISS